MPTFHAGSSALVKRRLAGHGPPWFHTLTSAGSGNHIETAQLRLVEVISALNRWVRRGASCPRTVCLFSCGVPGRRAYHPAGCALPARRLPHATAPSVASSTE
jgi:hypothetical protein